MSEEREKTKQTLLSFQTDMRVSTNAIFTQIQATTGFNIFVEKAVTEMFKELKYL